MTEAVTTISPAEALRLFRQRTQEQEARLIAIVQDAEAEAARQAAEILAQTELTEAEKRRQAERERIAGLLDDWNVTIAGATEQINAFAARIDQLRAMSQRAEKLHAEIVDQSIALEAEVNALAIAVAKALPAIPDADAGDMATEGLQRAGLGRLNWILPGWLLALNEKRWLSTPGVRPHFIFMTAADVAKRK